VKIIPTYDATINARPNAVAIKNIINKACAFYQTKFTDDITVNITFMDVGSGLGQSNKPLYTMPYSTFIAALRRDATTANDTKALALLPQANIDPVQNQPNIIVSQANLKALGFAVPAGSDGTIGLNTKITFTSSADNSGGYDLYGVVSHEIDEILGLGSGLGFPASVITFFRAAVLPQDLFRYDASGARSFTTDTSAVVYFSIDGTTRLAKFNNDGFGDYGDWYSGYTAVTPQVQDAYATPGVAINRSMPRELISLDVIGYNASGSGTASNSLSAAAVKSMGKYNSYQKPRK
jgi:hypothetical protein